MSDKLVRLHALIDSGHEWPGDYLFKFIVPKDKLVELESHFEGVQFFTRPSANGRFVSLTYKGHFQSSDQVMAIYERVLAIEGIVSL
ncbi:MAG: DUF493 family protein [Candidatus Hydrogenedentes bacterium]|nr:DUF493 family protein [Candidatus Hydrogenedentota bacterium]